ncbi:acyl-CoA dehydrogenase family protein [Enemella sp. A6]|uniref:acyl-CoA dehydrogenase family protein n=1 Tax=Enemella sp. A6 TaxID=3440152 RepID=UPI003EB85100
MSVKDQILATADEYRSEALEADKLNQLSDATVARMKEQQVIRMLQPAEYGGLEVGPREFAETVMTLAALHPSAGWVAGVVGVHPWQLALGTKEVQDEVWGEDPDTWIASPYMPNGLAIRVEGGYRMSGRWSFSSGTDHCRWLYLGAMKCDEEGNMVMPPQMLHVNLPRSDYEIVPDSWDVVGLLGTGSKDIVVKDAFIPDHRLMAYDDVVEGVQWREMGVEKILYQLPWSMMFPLGISAATIGIAQGLYDQIKDYQRDRVGAEGNVIKDDPIVMYHLGRSGAQLRAAREAILSNAQEIYDIVAAGEEVSFARRAEGRRNQVDAVWTAVRAVDDAYARCGGTALRNDSMMQKYWRDMQAGLHHAIHVATTPYQAAALSELGFEPQGPLRAMI